MDKGRNTIHEEVEATWCVFEMDGKKYLQMDTYGRNGRKYEGKTSQSIQLDEESARALADLIRKNFE